MAKYVLRADTGVINLSPTLFREYARQYLECRRSFAPDAAYSPVPYFLLCRALELELKARHLESKSRAEVKRLYGHNIKRAYDQLPNDQQILDPSEYKVLSRASEIYDVPNKGFEYVELGDALTKLKHFPSLAVLEGIASKLVKS